MIFYAKGQRKMKISKKWIQLCNIVCAVLMLALLVCQFLPFWTMPACNCTGECEKLNVNKDCPACSSYFKWCVNLPEEGVSNLVVIVTDTSFFTIRDQVPL